MNLILYSSSFFLGDDKIRAILKWVSLLTACCLVFAVQLGIQTLPFLLSGELFPSDIRAFCKGITRSFACILLIGGLKMFPTLENTIGIHGTFYSFSAVMILCTPVIYCVVPETKDMSLEMVENYFLPNRTRFYVDLIRYYSKCFVITIYLFLLHLRSKIFILNPYFCLSYKSKKSERKYLFYNK